MNPELPAIARELRAERQRLARPERHERPHCGARCRDGRPCAARVAWPKGAPAPRTRCRMHGGASTGPRTREGLVRALAAIGRTPRADTAQRRHDGQAHDGQVNAAA